jgi:hypothetical protein
MIPASNAIAKQEIATNVVAILLRTIRLSWNTAVS